MNSVERCACLAAALITAADGAIFALGRWANGLYAEEPLWIVAQYSFPWALATVGAAIGVAWLWLLRQAMVRKVSLRRLGESAVVAFMLSFAVCLEAGMGIYYQQVTGEFHVTAIALSRTKLDFPSTEDGVCLHAELRSPLTWLLNGIPVHPRLLPLPLDDERLQARLLSPGSCSGR